MDGRLFQAAWDGNVEHLQKLLEEDPRILHTVALSSGETPLHVACLAGHLDFVKEVIRLRKEFALELNQDGFSPMHIGSASGHLEIVKELLKIDRSLILLKGREGRIPLHYAVIKGRIQIVRELLKAGVDSIEYVTARGETVFYLAVNNNQFEVFKVLVEQLEQSNKEHVLNKKDDQGNTILHYAVSRKQYEVIKLLLTKYKNKVEVNSINKRGLTPFDVLQFIQSEPGDREIEELLKRAEAKKAEDIQSASSTETLVVSTDHQTQTPARQLEEYFKYEDIKDSPSKVRNTLLVIAILIATATYQAVLSPPGGLWQDDSQGSVTNNRGTTTVTRSHEAGEAIMGSHNPAAYRIFLISNAIGFFLSLHIINFLTVGFPLRLELQFSLAALVVTYDASMTSIIPGCKRCTIAICFTTFSLVLLFLIPTIAKVARNYLRWPSGHKYFLGMNRARV